MKLHSYLERVIGSKTAIALVRVLLNYPGKIFTIRGLAETAGVSASEASLVVRQLEEAGVLKLQPVGKSFLITPNEQSFVLRRIMKPIVQAEGQTIGELTKLLKECFGVETISVYLFGSVAKGEEKDDSDIDLLVISDDFENASAAVSKAQEKVAAVFNKQLSPLIFSEQELYSKRKGRAGECDRFKSRARRR